jgi:hypothetical protein
MIKLYRAILFNDVEEKEYLPFSIPTLLYIQCLYMFIMTQLYNRKGEIRGGATTPYTLLPCDINIAHKEGITRERKEKKKNYKGS